MLSLKIANPINKATRINKSNLNTLTTQAVTTNSSKLSLIKCQFSTRRTRFSTRSSNKSKNLPRRVTRTKPLLNLTWMMKKMISSSLTKTRRAALSTKTCSTIVCGHRRSKTYSGRIESQQELLSKAFL